MFISIAVVLVSDIVDWVEEATLVAAKSFPNYRDSCRTFKDLTSLMFYGSNAFLLMRQKPLNVIPISVCACV